LRLADKLFWAPIAALATAPFAKEPEYLAAQVFLAAVFLFCGMYLRHCGLVVLDALPPAKQENGRKRQARRKK
jgi:hypothetical protein